MKIKLFVPATFEVSAEALASLTPREEKCMLMIADGKTLNDIGKHFHVHYERALQIQEKATRKLLTKERLKLGCDLIEFIYNETA